MAYVPPHKRKNMGALSPTRPPESMIPRNPVVKTEKNVYQADNAISKWFVVGLAEENRLASLTHLEPVDMESFDRKSPLALLLNDNGEQLQASPWIDVVEAVKQDLFASFELAKNEARNCEFQETKQALVLRLGRVHFWGSSSFTAESLKGSSLPVSTLEQLHKTFNTNVPPSYMEYITSNVVPKINVLDSDQKERELYHVKLFDQNRPDSTISCKCSVVKDRNQLEHSKILLNQMRLLTVDMLCVGEDMDLRLMLSNKRVLVELTEEEREGIGSLVRSAVLDSDVKGGLRWPSGKQSADGRFKVIGAMHTEVKTYCNNSSTRLRVGHADRFDFQTSSGEAGNEVVLKLPGIVSLLQEDKVNTQLVLQKLEDNLKLIWKNFLSFV